MRLDARELAARGFRGLRVVGDVHGDATAFAAALGGAEAEARFVVQLGDLTDYGPDAPGVLRAALGLVREGRGVVLLGNHDHKLRRALTGVRVHSPPDAVPRTLAQLRAAPDGEALAEDSVRLIAAAPAWARLGPWLFVHAAFHPAMLLGPPPEAAAMRRPEGALARALFGQVASGLRPDGYPIRLTGWVDCIPAGLTVYCGHDQRSRDGRPLHVKGRGGGAAVFLDTGAGKGGHLSWVDLPWPG